MVKIYHIICKVNNSTNKLSNIVFVLLKKKIVEPVPKRDPRSGQLVSNKLWM